MIRTRLMFYSWDRFFPLHKKGNSFVQCLGHSLSSTTEWRKDDQVTMGIWEVMVEGGHRFLQNVNKDKILKSIFVKCVQKH